MSGITVSEDRDRFDRAMDLLADLACEHRAASKRCEEVGENGLAIEQLSAGDAIRDALVDVIADALVFEGTGADEAEKVAFERVEELIAAAIERRGDTAVTA